jgi:hypothetical protein
MQEFVGQLSKSGKAKVLERLMKNEPSLTQKIYSLALDASEEPDEDEVSKVPAAIDKDAIAEDVYSEISSLDEDELYSRSGKTRHGYVEACDAAYEMLDDAMEPFMDKLREFLADGPTEMAKAYCIGLIRGLKKGSNCNAVMECLPDSAHDLVEEIIVMWKNANPSQKDFEDVSKS